MCIEWWESVPISAKQYSFIVQRDSVHTPPLYCTSCIASCRLLGSMTPDEEEHDLLLAFHEDRPQSKKSNIPKVLKLKYLRVKEISKYITTWRGFRTMAKSYRVPFIFEIWTLANTITRIQVHNAFGFGLKTTELLGKWNLGMLEMMVPWAQIHSNRTRTQTKHLNNL